MADAGVKEPDSTKSKRFIYDGNELPRHAAFYISNVLAEYDSTIAPGWAPHPADLVATNAFAIATQIHSRPQPWSWSDLYALEIAIARLQPAERLRRRICVLREKYKALVGDAAYQTYLTCSRTNVEQADIEQLRAEMETLLREFQWYYSTTYARDELFHDLRRNLVVPILVYGVAIVIYAWYQVLKGQNIPGLLIVIFAGMTGAFASILRRIQLAQVQSASVQSDTVANLSSLGVGQLSVFLALASGAIFPVVLLLLFIGGMLQGALFPEMYTPNESDEGMKFLDFALDTAPMSGVDFAKLLVWSFMSGFAERFVPDVLDRFVSRASQAATGMADQGGGAAS